MMKCSFSGLALALSFASLVSAQPAATQPVAIDQSTPRAALKTFITGMTRGDGPAIRSVIVTTSPLEHKLLDALIAQQQALAKFQAATTTRLGPRASRRLMGDQSAAQATILQELEEVPEHIDGDRATIGDDELEKQDGKWVLTMASMIPIACGATSTDTESLNESIDMMNTRAALFSQVTDELNQGKYTTVAQVQRAMEAKDQKTATTKSDAPTGGLAEASRDVDALKERLKTKSPEELITSLIPLGAQHFGGYDYYHDYMANMAIREELASRGEKAREALKRHADDTTRIFEAVNGPGDTVGRICRQLLTAKGSAATPP